MIKRLSSILTNFETKSSYQYMLLVAITLLATGLRFYKLGEWSFWIDEISTIRRAQAHVNLETIINQWWQPALSLILIDGALDTLGLNEWSARLVPAVIGVISIPVLYFPIKKLFGPAVALIAVFLLAISPWHLYWSQNARFYTSLMLLYSLASFAFFFSLEQDRPWYILGFFSLLFLAVGERVIALFIAPVVICYLLLLRMMPFERPSGLRARNLLFFLLPGIAFAMHEVYGFVTNGNIFLAHAFETFVGKPIDSPVRILILIVFNIGIPLVILAFFGGIYLLSQKNRPGLFLFIGAVVPPLLLAAANPFVFTVDRYVFIALPSWIILGALAVKEIFCGAQNQGKVLAAGILVLLLADAAGAHLMYYQINHGNRPVWKDAFEYIQAHKEDSDVVVSAVANVGTYYMGEEVLWLGDIKPDIITTGNKRYWFVIDSENGWWSGKEKQWTEENSEFVEAWYLRTREDMHLRIYLYDPGRRVQVEQPAASSASHSFYSANSGDSAPE